MQESSSSCPGWFDFPFLIWSVLALIAFEVLFFVEDLDVQWQWMGLYGFALIALCKYSRSPLEFFKGGIGETATDRSSFMVLSSSAFISWIFAKSIQNSSKLGAKYGIFGGVGYATWYTAFFSVAIVCYFIRKQGYSSLPEAINDRYGPLACLSFSCAVLYRLYQEVWSNSTVVASFYGAHDTTEWWLAAIISTVIPFIYVFLGGLRSSLRSDALQAVLAILLLIVVLSVIGGDVSDLKDACEAQNRDGCGILSWDPKPGVSSWSWKGGLDLFVVGLLQGCLSYGFFDPVLTDRAFLAEPGTMVRAFCLGGLISGLFITFFSLIGVYGNMASVLDPDATASGISTGVPSAVAKHLGTAMYSMVNIIFLTSSISTLDSTFSSTAKISAELTSFFQTCVPQKLSETDESHLMIGRIGMFLIAVGGTLPLLQDPNELSATTVSGTVVLGLGPPVLALTVLPKSKYYPLSFLFSFWIGAFWGFCYQYSNEEPEKLDWNGEDWELGDGSYAKLLYFNVVGTAATFGIFAIMFVLEHNVFNDYSCYRNRIENQNKTIEMGEKMAI